MNWESSCVDLLGSLDRFRGSTWPGFYVLFVSVGRHLTKRNLHEDSMYQNNEPVKLQVADQSEEISLKFSVQETAAYGRKSGRKSVHKGGHARILSMCPNKKDK